MVEDVDGIYTNPGNDDVRKYKHYYMVDGSESMTKPVPSGWTELSAYHFIIHMRRQGKEISIFKTIRKHTSEDDE